MDYVAMFLIAYCLTFAVAMGIGMFILLRWEGDFESEYQEARPERQFQDYLDYYHFENANDNGTTIVTDFTRLN